MTSNWYIPQTGPSTVLLVENDPATREKVSQHLATAGYQVITAFDAHEALQILLTNGPRLVVSGWTLPGMSGLELCRAIRDHEALRYTFVLLMSDDAYDEDRFVQAFEAGAADCVAAPIGHRELVSRVRAGERIVHLQADLDRRNVEVHRSNAELEIAYMELAEANTKLNRLATIDPLTGLTNRRAAMEHLADLWTGTERHNVPLACIMLDVDYFKNFNDLFGHAIGDEVLRQVGGILQKATRRGERCCRVGGEEFLVLCPHSTQTMAAVGAERLRRCVAEHIIRSGDLSLNVTVSAGVAQRSSDMRSADELMRAADAALYAAKDAGRNRVALACADHDPAAEQPAQPRPLKLPLFAQNQSNILVLDDDAAARTIAARMLAAEGYRVWEAVDPAEALTRLQRETTHVVILDAALTCTNGLDFVRKLKAASETRNIPVIMMVGRGALADLSTAFESGVDEYITKPLNVQELAFRVRSMLRLRREITHRQDAAALQTRALTLIHDYIQVVMAEDSSNPVLQATARVAADLADCRHAAILIPAKHDGPLTIAAAHDPQVMEPLALPSLPAQQARATGVPILLNSGDDAEAWRKQLGDGIPATLPFLAQPLIVAGEVVGVLEVALRRSESPFGKPELALLRLLGDVAACAISNLQDRRTREAARDAIVIALARLAEYRDADAGHHLSRVASYCVVLARALRRSSRFAPMITDAFIADIELAAPLHDIGKVAVPDHVLNKPGPLDPQELSVMRAHASIGASAIRSMLAQAPATSFLVLAEEIAHGHHEWYNGNGYPRGLSGDDIPLAARIAAVADVYDALTTRRVYKDAVTHNRAVQIIREGSGTQFDREVAEAFLANADEFHRIACRFADDVERFTPPAPARPVPALAHG